MRDIAVSLLGQAKFGAMPGFRKNEKRL